MSQFCEIHFTSNDGLNLVARDYAASAGSAKCAVICLHGLTRNSADFDDLAPWIASLGRRVLAIDMRGRGESDHDPDPSHYQTAQYVADVVKLAADLGIARAVFIGTSMGGMITMSLALRHLDLIAAAILNDIGPTISRSGLNRIRNYVGKTETLLSWQQAVDYVMTINQTAFPHNTLEDWGKWTRRAFTQTPAGAWQLKYDPKIALAFQNGQLKASSLMAKWAFRRLARQRPTLLIRGALSDLIDAQQAAHLRRVAPSMQYVEVPEVGHAPMLNESVAMEAIGRFLLEVD